MQDQEVDEEESCKPLKSDYDNKVIGYLDSENKVNNDEKEEEEEGEKLTQCGLGSWRPQWMQRFAKPQFFLVNLSLVGVIQSMNSPLFIGSMSTLEKRYAFDSKISGMIMIADNFSQLLLSPLIGYFALNYNRSRLIATGEVILALSCYFTVLPYFIYGPSDLSSTSNPNPSSFSQASYELCGAGSVENCGGDQKGTTVWPAVAILLMGSFFRGIGFTCYFVIGFSYLDDNVNKGNSPLYISVMQSIRLLGPALGFMLSAFCLQFYEKPSVDPGFPTTDPRFVGAWWLGFIILGTLLLLASIPMFCFPYEFKGASVKGREASKRLRESGGSVAAMKRFIHNPLVLLFLLGTIFRYGGLGGAFMFKTKYIESQYRVSSSSASFITGTTSVLPSSIGILIGGVILTWLKPRPKRVILMVCALESVLILTYSSGFFLGCHPVTMHGEERQDGSFTLNTNCNTDCHCNTQVFTPICARDRHTYFSGCHAGCKTFNSLNQTLEDCACTSGSLTLGYCPKDVDGCSKNLYAYLLINLIGQVVSAMARTAYSLISFRSVDPMDKTFTVGFTSALLAIFCFIPYPIVFGTIIDAACKIWETKCGQTGNCWLYDQAKFRNHYHGTTISMLACGVMIDCTMIFFAHRIKNFYGDDEDGETKDTQSSNEEIIQLNENEKLNNQELSQDQMEHKV